MCLGKRMNTFVCAFGLGGGLGLFGVVFVWWVFVLVFFFWKSWVSVGSKVKVVAQVTTWRLQFHLGLCKVLLCKVVCATAFTSWKQSPTVFRANKDLEK